ncbi:hypothetical protein KCP76_01005 [Salmonella enterica subsp. enterica serovar Weltevreden]|nr:hypothetical protein KCP76_01005 [Salmonella enterica subsp. enterica serovar Weltevreden]
MASVYHSLRSVFIIADFFLAADGLNAAVELLAIFGDREAPAQQACNTSPLFLATGAKRRNRLALIFSPARETLSGVNLPFGSAASAFLGVILRLATLLGVRSLQYQDPTRRPGSLLDCCSRS